MAKDIVNNQQTVTHEVAPDSVRKGHLLIRYDKSFTARIIQGEDELRDYYDQLKAELLSYKGVKSRISWKHESFRIGKVLVALLKIRGKHISIYLPLDANDYADTKYKVDDVSNVKANAETPCAYAIKNGRRCLYAKDLIATVMAAQQSEKQDVAPVEYTDEYPYDTTSNLIERELIKLVYSKIGARGKEVALKDVTEEEIQALMAEDDTAEEVAEEPVEEVVEEVVEEPVEEVVEEQPVEEVVEEEPVEEPIEEVVEEEPVEEVVEEQPVEEVVEEPAEEVVEEQPVEEVAEPEPAPVVKKKPRKHVKVEVEVGTRYADKTKTGIINVDTLSRHFHAGETVTLEEIKERVPYFHQDVTYVKVLARGNINVALTVEADSFSAYAVEKITAKGGKVITTLKK